MKIEFKKDTELAKIVKKLKKFCTKASEGKVQVSEELIERFGERCKDALRKQFSEKEPFEFSYRPSMLGKHIVDLQCQKLGLDCKEDMSPWLINRFLFGDIGEAFMFMLLEANGLEFEDEQKQTEVDLAGHRITGTLDLKINGEVVDIKTASQSSYYKFTKDYSYFKNNDAYGYCAQGAIYAKAENTTFGGWLVMNINNGEISALDAHEMNIDYEINNVENKIKILDKTEDICDINREDVFVSEDGAIDSQLRWCKYFDAMGIKTEFKNRRLYGKVS